MSHAQNLFNISATDRLGLTLFFAIALHAIIILGVGFDAELPKPEELPLTLEITLVHSKSEKAPDKADYLAQANQQGGGNVKERARPSSPFPNPRPVEQEGDAPQTQPLQLPATRPHSEQQPVLLAEAPSEQQWQQQEEPQTELPESNNAKLFMPNRQEIARLSAEIRQKQKTYAQMPREKYISANTREYLYASYEDSWRQKVERIGNLNYPDEAKSQGLSGSLLLDVAINPDGSLKSVRVERSSGHYALDNGALRIVRMASPFAPLPPEIRKDVDVLHILRVWQFQDDYSLRTR